MGGKCFIGVDVGSASVRAGLYNLSGERLGFATRPISQFHGKGDHVEQSSAEIWRHACEAIREAIATAGIDAEQVMSLGFDATCSLVAIGRDGQGVSVSETAEPARDIIMWMDHRAGTEAQEINATDDEALRYVGGEVSIEMELPKVLWLKKHLPAQYQQAWRLFDLADFLVWKATDVDAASVCTLTCKWNYLAHEKRFSDKLLNAVGLSDLCEKVPSHIAQIGERIGFLSETAARDCGLHTGVAVASGLIDAHAGGVAMLGASPKAALAIISGTSNCHMITHPQEIFVEGVWGPYWSAMLPQLWLGEGGQSAAGALVDWTLSQHGYYPDLVQQAEDARISPYQLLNRWVLELERQETYPTRALHVLGDHHGNRSPRADHNARGAVFGLTLERGKTALARLYLATLQSIAYGTRHIIDAMTQAGHVIDDIFLCGGATRNPLWLREYANATGRPVRLIQDDDPVTLGAAISGAVAAGLFDDFASACQDLVRRGEIIKPEATHSDFHAAKYAVYLDMYDQQKMAQKTMSAFVQN
ncbi:FGGY-family carbohydrate kinase [Pantoea rwandensis]|uniref:Sugar kinase n=1 Tax=Pantoea rwandensis TaxID=1076550 RepID=A0A1X1D3H0_9GAMM|nr:FGGY-family carbohydrate kinase [Pantoea rwandensis]ORM71196.1 sugar kinase [Pantoea rwandensis]